MYQCTDLCCPDCDSRLLRDDPRIKCCGCSWKGFIYNIGHLEVREMSVGSSYEILVGKRSTSITPYDSDQVSKGEDNRSRVGKRWKLNGPKTRKREAV